MVSYHENLIGILPKNFVQLINIPEYLITSDSTERLFLAIDDFNFAENGDLEFNKSDIIISQSNVDENWHFGYCIKDLTRTGIFPLTHVAEIYLETSSPQKSTNDETTSIKSNQSSKQILRQAISLYPFDSLMQPMNDADTYLKFEKGDYILVTGEFEDKNWLQGENLNGEKGMFPSNYIQFISSNIV